MAGISTPAFHLILTLLIASLALSRTSSVCLHHLGCYHDNRLHLDHVTTYYSQETKRNAENCARLCLQRRRDSEIVLVKLESVDELLFCGCGDYHTLGNHTGRTFDNLGCYVCPDSLNEKCGSEKMSSVYEIVRYSEEPCRSVLDLPPPVTTTTTTPTPTTEMEDSPPPEHNTTTNNTNLSPPNSPPAAVTTVLQDFHHLGCYDENDVNQTLVVTEVVESAGNGIKNCADTCASEHPTAEVLLVKVLNDFYLYCGCGLASALPANSGVNNTQCDMTCTVGNTTAVHCGGWMSVNAYERSNAALPSSNTCFLALSLVLAAILRYTS